MRTLLTLIALSLTANPACADDESDLSALQGTWIVTSYINDGDEVESMRAAYVQIDGKVFTLRVGEDTFHGTLNIDAAKSPKQIEATYTDGPNEGKTFLGIYKFQDGQLIDCYKNPGSGRPDNFESVKGSQNRLITHRRAPMIHKGDLADSVRAFGVYGLQEIHFRDVPTAHAMTVVARIHGRGDFTATLKNGDVALDKQTVNGNSPIVILGAYNRGVTRGDFKLNVSVETDNGPASYDVVLRQIGVHAFPE